MIKAQYNSFILDNGLRVIHRPDESTNMVALSVLYDTGARDEASDRTGMAHLMEHLMFTGSPNAPKFDEALSRAGGINNAWTSNDFTCFHDIVPAHNAETVFWLESDRMIDLNFKPEAFEAQKKVVVQEFYQECLNKPYGRLAHEIRRLAYPRHPYRWPVIGLDPSHIENTTLDQVKDFYHNHYSTSNALIAVVGNIPFEEVKRLTQKWFGGISPRIVAPRHLPEPAPFPKDCISTIKDNAPNALISISYLTDGYGTEDYFTADLISDILSSGRSSVFYRNLVDRTSLFDQLDASISGSEHKGLFTINAILRKRASVKKAIHAINNELYRFCENEVAEFDRERALNRIESTKVFENLEPMAQAQNLALLHYHNELPAHNIKRYHRISPASVKRVASSLFNQSNPVTVIYQPKNVKTHLF